MTKLEIKALETVREKINIDGYVFYNQFSDMIKKTIPEEPNLAAIISQTSKIFYDNIEPLKDAKKWIDTLLEENV